jgi:hypothetical protein
MSAQNQLTIVMPKSSCGTPNVIDCRAHQTQITLASPPTILIRSDAARLLGSVWFSSPN